MNIMYLYGYEVDDDVDFVCIHVKMTSFRVTIVCFWNSCIPESSGKVHYVGRRRRLFACHSNMDLNQFKRFICFKIGLEPTKSTVNISFKYDMSGELLAFPVEDDEAINAMWEHSKSTQILSLELYVEKVPLGNVVASNPTPTLMPISTEETVNHFVPFANCTLSQPLVPIDSMVNLGESDEMGPWDDGNESNELIDDPSEDDVYVDEDALANDITLGNIPTIIPPTPYL
ncbi:uncharacterized protein LOC130823603 isoform X1 [Amaranthus tricolor]|uniref:uncharacterized protein LOC130823603 isoform X1 n=1 Tax=Amaranthus tricolor TaxID=29722 RepID=UPI002589087A|nr:uncharacterized protein LOC130823603 isoform X1 [Amaranthus tricolor]XP_057544262.1 uncharacterized protein LOC130823603 isoform X1 [Amaranthus tricolor]